MCVATLSFGAFTNSSVVMCHLTGCARLVWGRSKCCCSVLQCVAVCCSVVWGRSKCSPSFLIQSHLCIVYCTYGVPLISRPLKIIRLFWRTSSLLQGSCATETNNLCIVYFYKKRVVDTSRCVYVSVCGCVYVGVCMCVCVSYLARSGLSTRKGVCVCVRMPVCHVWQQYGKGIGTRKGLLPPVLRDKTHGLINGIEKKFLYTHYKTAEHTFTGCYTPWLFFSVFCTHMNESCHTYEWVTTHLRVSHVTHECVMTHVWGSHVTHVGCSEVHI